MPIQAAHYEHRGKGNMGVVIECPAIVAPGRLVYFDVNRESRNWTIRDFITSVWLRSQDSRLTTEQVEAATTHSEFPPWCSIKDNPHDWRVYLLLRTTALRLQGHDVSMVAANENSGLWRPL